jgi:hypothetical protein
MGNAALFNKLGVGIKGRTLLGAQGLGGECEVVIAGFFSLYSNQKKSFGVL